MASPAAKKPSTKTSSAKKAPPATKTSSTKQSAKKVAPVTKPAKKSSATAKASGAPKLKTTASAAPVAAFLSSLDPATRADCERLAGLMTAATGADGVMYGKAIVGFGSATIRYADGREAPWMKMGFSPRKQALTLYGVLSSATPAQLDALGKHDTGKDCLYVKRLADVNLGALEKIIRAAARA